MRQSEFIAAIDLGTSKMSIMVGKKNDQGVISIIASEQDESGVCIRRGCIYNVEKTTSKINNLMKLINRKVNPKVEKVYVGLGGQSLKLIEHSVIRKLNQDTMITQSLIASLSEECKSYEPEFAEILDIASPEYYLDGRYEQNPVGIQCSGIEARFKILVGRPSLKRTLSKSIEEKAGIKVAGYIIAPLATAEAVLSDREKDLGCALIEFGAGITYVLVYKNKILKYLVTIPLGGDVITKDLCELNVTEKEAELLKIKFGSALSETNATEQAETANLAESLLASKKMDLDKLNNIIEARVDEILANVIHQIELSGFSKSLGAGIIMTGGSAGMKNLSKSLMQKTGYEVRTAAAKRALVNQAAETALKYENSQIIGMLALGTENCADESSTITQERPVNQQETLFKEEEISVQQTEKQTEKPKKERKSIFGGIKHRFDDFSKSLFEEDEQ